MNQKFCSLMLISLWACFGLHGATPYNPEEERKAAVAAEQGQHWEPALQHYENIYDATATDDATRADLRKKFAELRPQVAANTEPGKAGNWRIKAYAFRELDFQWKSKTGTNRHAQFRYREDELERLAKGMAGFSNRVWQYSWGNLRIEWTLKVIDEPLKKLDGKSSFWPGPWACMAHLSDFKKGDADTIMVFAKVSGDRSKGETDPAVPQMLFGGAYGSLGETTRHATYIGFNWGSGAASNEPDGEPMLHEWLHSVEWTLLEHQHYPRGLMFTSDGGRREGEDGGDPCYRRKKSESSWMGFYEHLMRDHVTRRMWRELSLRRPAENVWNNRAHQQTAQ